MLAARRDVHGAADEERADSEDAEAAFDQQLISSWGRSGDVPAVRRPLRHLVWAALVVALAGVSVVALASVSGRRPPAATAEARTAAALLEQLVSAAGVPGCEDAVGIDTPWGSSCQEVAGDCSDADHGDQVRGLCPVTCQACEGQPGQQASVGSVPPPSSGGQDTAPSQETGLPAAFEAQGGCEDRDVESCQKLAKFCVDHDMSPEVQGACPATCGVCDNPAPAAAPVAPVDAEQVPASAVVTTTTCPPEAKDCAVQSPAGADGAPNDGVDFDATAAPAPDAAAATAAPAAAPAMGGGDAAGPDGEQCEDRDMAMCAQILAYCDHDDLGAQVRNACKKSCGLCGAAPAPVAPAPVAAAEAPPPPSPAPTTAAPTTSAPLTAAPAPAAAPTPPPTARPTTAAPTTTEPATQPPTLAPTTTAAATTKAEEPAPAPVEVVGIKADTAATTLAPSEEELEPAPAPSQECTKPGEDCSLAQCCADPGMQCYEKNSGYATCHLECDPEEPDDDDEVWTCKELGPRTSRASEGNGTSCTEAGDDCSTSKCCEDPGFMCYSKNKYFSSCKTTCEKGERDTPKDDPWECKELGERTPWPPEMQICQWPADNCIISKCCKMPETTCYKQDEYFASCKDVVEWDPEGKNADWDGEELGGFNESIDNPVEPVGEGEGAGSSLYCIVVVTPGYVAEEELVSQQEASGVGAFACDASSKMEGQAVGKGEWQSVQNTAVFVDIWNRVVEEGTYQSYDWTVKIDPDAVFFPNRLKGKIEALNAPRDFPLYLKNCGFKFGFMGSLEIFSRAAVDVYNENQGECLVNIGTDGGEDFYMKTCMDAIGVGHMEDMSLLRDRYDFVAFPGDFSPSALDDCSDGGAVAYHPHKSWDNWQECKSMSEDAEGANDWGGDQGGDGGDQGGDGGDQGGDGQRRLRL